MQVPLNSGSELYYFRSAGAVSDQRWHHLALTRRGLDLGLYLDGRLDTLLQVLELPGHGAGLNALGRSDLGAFLSELE